MFSQENQLNKYKYISYLIGSMEETAEGDGGETKREVIERELLARGVFAINPVTLEKSKTGMGVDKAKEFMDLCIKNKDFSTFKKTSREIWKGIDKYDVKHGLIHIPGDVDYVTMSNFITCLFQEGDKPCGTFMEVGIALEHDIPVYLLTNCNIENIKKSFLQGIFASGGAVFNDMGTYLNFLENEYNLTKGK